MHLTPRHLVVVDRVDTLDRECLTEHLYRIQRAVVEEGLQNLHTPRGDYLVKTYLPVIGLAKAERLALVLKLLLEFLLDIHQSMTLISVMTGWFSARTVPLLSTTGVSSQI